jgi:hypothetical protein
MRYISHLRRGYRRRADRRRIAVALLVAGAAGVVAIGPAGARSGPSFSLYSASGDIATWRVSFTETGLTPKSRIHYAATAQASATYNCTKPPYFDRHGGGHGAPPHFRIRTALSATFTGTANAQGSVRKTNAGSEGIAPPTCSDGSLPVLSSYALYNVRLVDTTSHVNAPSMRDHTTPRPR